MMKGERSFKTWMTRSLCHDIRKGLPFENSSVDVVYHSHILEHVERELVEAFLTEIKRVLVPGGEHRIAVPGISRQGTGNKGGWL
jgi:predicted SAM-dependent methyltransferase